MEMYNYTSTIDTNIIDVPRIISPPRLPEPVALTVAAMAVKYHAHIIKTKPPESKEDNPIGVTMRWLATVDCLADKFTPARLVALRQQWVDDGQSVSTISKKHNYVLCAFRWAAQMDMVPASVWTSLTTVTKIKPGRSAAKQPRKVHPVTDEHIDAIIPYLQPDVAAAVEFHRLTGCRSAEVLGVTLAQIHGGTYRPIKHKNSWRGKVRTIHLGKRALELVNLWGTDDVNKPLFYSKDSGEYGKRIKRACKRAGIPHFSPHQIRHAHGTKVRHLFGLDAAQAALGHSSARTTEIYAEVSEALAKKVSDSLG
jgi:integrase